MILFLKCSSMLKLSYTNLCVYWVYLLIVVKQFILILAFMLSVKPAQKTKGNELPLVCHQWDCSVFAISHCFLNSPCRWGNRKKNKYIGIFLESNCTASVCAKFADNLLLLATGQRQSEQFYVMSIGWLKDRWPEITSKWLPKSPVSVWVSRALYQWASWPVQHSEFSPQFLFCLPMSFLLEDSHPSLLTICLSCRGQTVLQTLGKYEILFF